MFIQHLSRAAQALAAPVVRLSRRSARFKVRLRAILLLCLSAAADTAIAVEAPVSFVTSFQVQSALEQYPGTRYFTVLLLHECPAGSVRSGPGCLTKKILYARKARGEAIPPDDILKPDPDLWKELKPHARFVDSKFYVERAQWGLATDRYVIEEKGGRFEPHSSEIVLVLHASSMDETGQPAGKLAWLSMLREEAFTELLPLKPELFSSISDVPDPAALAYQKGLAYVPIHSTYTHPTQYDRVIDWRLFFIKDLSVAQRSMGEVLAEKAEQEATRKKEEEKEKQEAAEHAAWVAKISTPAALKAAETQLNSAFKAFGNLAARNWRAPAPCDAIAQNSGAQYNLLYDTYRRAQGYAPPLRGEYYQNLLQEARGAHAVLQAHLRSTGCGR